jgi:hypothetical protein
LPCVEKLEQLNPLVIARDKHHLTAGDGCQDLRAFGWRQSVGACVTDVQKIADHSDEIRTVAIHRLVEFCIPTTTLMEVGDCQDRNSFHAAGRWFRYLTQDLVNKPGDTGFLRGTGAGDIEDPDLVFPDELNEPHAWHEGRLVHMQERLAVLHGKLSRQTGSPAESMANREDDRAV